MPLPASAVMIALLFTKTSPVTFKSDAPLEYPADIPEGLFSPPMLRFEPELIVPLVVTVMVLWTEASIAVAWLIATIRCFPN